VVDQEATYRRQTPGSRALHDAAVAVMPGGTTRTTTYFDPYPLFIDRGEGYFEPREVKTGKQYGDRIEIVSGLKKGERVVVSGNFLLDSESQLKTGR